MNPAEAAAYWGLIAAEEHQCRRTQHPGRPSRRSTAEDPFLLRRRGLPLRRAWIEQPNGEEDITLLEEEVIAAIQQCLARVDELDERFLAQQELQMA